MMEFPKTGVKTINFSAYYERTFSEMPFSCSWDSEEQDCNTGYTPNSCSLATLLFEKSTSTKEQINLRIMRELYENPGPNSKIMSIEQWEKRFQRKEFFRHPRDGC